jgi:hypothetical protein
VPTNEETMTEQSRVVLDIGMTARQRMAEIQITPTTLMRILKGELTAEVLEAIPADAAVIGARFNEDTQCFSLYVESDEFWDTPVGVSPIILTLRLRRGTRG